jgi:hypothetical protein
MCKVDADREGLQRACIDPGHLALNEMSFIQALAPIAR